LVTDVAFEDFMIRRAYILRGDCEVALRAKKLILREDKGKPLFSKRDEWEAELNTDWSEWYKEACQYIVHIYGDAIEGKRYDVRNSGDDIIIEENIMHFTNTKQSY
jgi:hypothetical protein